jgi:NAD(P)-dependent dehydrogenase (short-subunit alcohol dehydrogenase family)
VIELGSAKGVAMPPTAVVTGGARGLGREIAVALIAAGYQVVISGRDKDALAETAHTLDPSGARVLTVPADIRDEHAVDDLATATLQQFGRIDVLVNNSGIAGPTAPMWMTPSSEWLEAITTNVYGTFLCCRAMLPAMVTQRSGSIITIGSMTGKRPLLGRTSYAASKTALIGLTRTLAAEAGPFGIRVNLISPGPLEGERIRRVFADQARSRGITAEDARAEMVLDSPLGRLVPPSDVAAAVVFLAGTSSQSVTGEDLNVSAGIVTY